ncbi:MAG: NAD(P)H-dependent oxidoreductase [Acholeplasmatales bacterium]|nr:NAD(P)H-dependent oxidoreductase [Acholeplasmatales bacterium]
MDKILYINSCVREESRTNKLAKYLLDKLNGNIVEVNLNKENIRPLNSSLLKKRDKLREINDYNDDLFKYAKELRDADIVVISSPYWDLSFSSLLKIYFENVNIGGITFGYDENGNIKSLCHIKKLYYVTTAGGYIQSDEYGFGYVKSMFNTFYNVNDISYIRAEGLDIYGNNIDNIMNFAKMDIEKLFK